MTLKIELMFIVETFLYKPLERSLWQRHLTKRSSHTECPRPQLFYISDRDGDPSWTNWTSSSFTVAEHQPVDLESAVCPCYRTREIFQYSVQSALGCPPCSSGCDEGELRVKLNLGSQYRREAHHLPAARRSNALLHPRRSGLCETSTYLCDERSAWPPLASARIPARSNAAKEMWFCQ